MAVKPLTLRTKDRFVLSLVVESYLQEGKPVSSDLITRLRALSDSPATIRNIMAKLEGGGYLFKPHTSAGRVPTDKGLRLYVNDLLGSIPLAGESAALFPAGSLAESGDFPSLLRQVSRMLAEESDNLGFVLSPRISRITFNHIRFIRLAENKVLVILLTTFNLVLNEIVLTSSNFIQHELDEAAAYLNTGFRGKNLATVLDYLAKELPHYQGRSEPVVARLVELLKACIHQEKQTDPIYLQGASRLLDKAAEFHAEKLRALFRHVEEKARLARLISDFISLERVKVLIGSEEDLPDMADCALVLSHYGTRSQVLGSLGIIGPKRIPYQKIIPLVDSIAVRLSQTISRNP